MSLPSSPRSLRFPLLDLDEQVEAFASRWPAARAADDGCSFLAAAAPARLRLPLAGPRAVPGERIGDYAERLPGAAELQLVLLLQAGAMALGCWRGDELLEHKAVRRYVVRGSGRAQPTHLKTRGKSRYGSRLRLQNWRRLLVDTNRRLTESVERLGEPDRVFFAVPVRAWSELFAADPPPPFARDAALLQRIPMHVHRPDHGELLRVRAWLCHGRLELPPPA